MPRRDDVQDRSAQWLAQANQLKMRLKSALKDRDAVLDTLRTEVLDKDTFDEIEGEDRNHARQRSEESEAVMKQLRQVKSNVSALRQLIESRGAGADYVDKLRRAMDAAENEVYVAREAQKERMDIICAEERKISRELTDVEKMIQAWMNESTRPQSAQDGTRGRSAGRGASRERPDEAVTISSRVETAFQPTELPPEVRVNGSVAFSHIPKFASQICSDSSRACFGSASRVVLRLPKSRRTAHPPAARDAGRRRSAHPISP